jgi:hypothetical protein
MAKKRALLIGINDYPFLADFAQLKGCLNDVFLFKQVITDKFGFEEKYIRTLLNENATRKSILKALNDLTDECGNDDCVVLFFSGHGSRLNDKNFVKTSGWFETIMPFDSGRLSAHPKAVNRDITDVEIGNWLFDLSSRTANIVLIFDSCFASSIIRDNSFSSQKKGIAPDKTPLDNASVYSSPETARLLKKGRSGWLPLDEKYVLFSAAREYEPANIHKPAGNDQQFGVFTFFLCEALRESKPGATYLDIWEYLYIRVKALFADQNPELEGKRDRRLFGLREFIPYRFLPVATREKNRIILSGGEIHNVSKNSEWAILPSGNKLNKADTGSYLGKVNVVSTECLTAEAEITEEISPGIINAGHRAIEISPPKTKNDLNIWFENTVPRLEDLFEKFKTNLRRSHSFELVEDRDQADVVIRLREVRDSQLPEFSKFDRQTGRILPVWLVCSLDNRLLMPPCPIGKSGDSVKIVENLKILGRYHQILSLRNPDSLLSGKIDFQILRRESEKNWHEIVPQGDDPGLVIYQSEQIALRIINHFTEPIYFTILDLGLSKSVTQIYPPPGADIMIGSLGKNPIAAADLKKGTGILTIGHEATAGFRLFFPPNYPYSLGETTTKPNEGLEIYKLVVTTRPHDLSYLEQSGYRTIPKTSADLVENLIFGAFRGDPQFGEETLSIHKNEWTTIEKPFILRERR